MCKVLVKAIISKIKHIIKEAELQKKWFTAYGFLFLRHCKLCLRLRLINVNGLIENENPLKQFQFHLVHNHVIVVGG